MKLSIIVTNFNRDWYLDRSIPLMAAQTFPQDDFEYIVVDDGSHDASNTIIRKHSRSIKNFRYARRKSKRERFGNPALARNVGIRISSGACILFTDPEVMVMPDWAQKHYLAHCAPISDTDLKQMRQLTHKTDEIPDTSEIKDDRLVLGRALLIRNLHVIPGFWEGHLTKDPFREFDWRNITDVWQQLNKRIEAIDAPDDAKRVEFFIYQATQGGMSASRAMVEKIRGFDEDFSNPDLGLDKWAGEDTWFLWCADRVGSGKVEEFSARAVHLPHYTESHGYYGPTVANQRAKDNPDLYEANIGREWGLIEENGFEVVI